MSDLNEVQKGLLSQNVILLEGDVKGAMVFQVYESLSILESRGSPDVEIRIFSPGGNVGAGLDIYDAIRRYPGKKKAVVYACANSMGAIILQACDERVVLKHAGVLIHHISRESVSLDDLEDEERLAKLRDDMRERQQALYDILVIRTGKTEEEVREACRKDKSMSAEEALAFGLVDRIEGVEPQQPKKKSK